MHNYVKKIDRMHMEGKIPTGVGLHMLKIYHDDWCGVFEGARCDCDPDIQVREDLSAEEAAGEGNSSNR